MTTFKIGDRVVTDDNFIGILNRKLANYNWEVIIPIGTYHYEILHEDDFKLDEGDL